MDYVVMNLERDSSWQAQTDSFLRGRGVGVCFNDYTATIVNPVRDIFAPPGSAGSSPRPVFAVINCLTNSPTHAYRELLVNEIYPGGGAINFTPSILNWRTVIDSVKPPPPLLSRPGIRSDGNFEFTLTGFPGRFYRIESTADFDAWTTVATNLAGSPTGHLVSDSVLTGEGSRFYRAVQQ